MAKESAFISQRQRLWLSESDWHLSMGSTQDFTGCQWASGRFLSWNLHYWMLTCLLTIVSISPSSLSPSLRPGGFWFGFISGELSCLSQNWCMASGSSSVTNNVFFLPGSRPLTRIFFPFKQTSCLHNYTINTDYLTLNDGLKSWSLRMSFTGSCCPLGVCSVVSNISLLVEVALDSSWPFVHVLLQLPGPGKE